MAKKISFYFLVIDIDFVSDKWLLLDNKMAKIAEILLFWPCVLENGNAELVKIPIKKKYTLSTKVSMC